MKIGSTYITAKKNFRGNFKAILDTGERLGVYSFSLLLSWLLVRVPHAMFTGKKISLTEISEINLLSLVIFASFFVTGIVVLRYLPGAIQRLDIFFGMILYISVVVFISGTLIAKIIRDNIHESLILILLLIAVLSLNFEFKIEKWKTRHKSAFRKPKLSSENPHNNNPIPEGYNPT